MLFKVTVRWPPFKIGANFEVRLSFDVKLNPSDLNMFFSENNRKF